MKQINEEFLFAGYGGQGIMLMGKMLAFTAMNLGYNATWIPSYGAEVRGGTAHSMVRIKTNEKIANPSVGRPSICIVMNNPSLAKFIGLIKPGGLLIVDTTEIGHVPNREGIEIKKIPITKYAAELGDKRAANMIALGFLNKEKEFFPLNEFVKNLKYIFPNKKELLEINTAALEKGYGYI